MDVGMESLMEFRLTYLRMIAHVWRHDPSPACITEDLLKQFGRRHRWSDLEVKFQPGVLEDGTVNGAQWDPVATAGWFGDRNNTLTLGLPLDPKGPGLTPENRTEALAAFYSQHSTIFGSVVGSDDNGERRSDGGGLPSMLGGGLQSQLGGFDPFLEFGGVVSRALSVAWAKPEFGEALKKDAVLAMEGWLGYRCPWSLHIKVEDASDRLRYDDRDKRWQYHPTPDRQKLNRIEYHLPVKPDDDAICPVALTSYNNTGPQYPFTCCF